MSPPRPLRFCKKEVTTQAQVACVSGKPVNSQRGVASRPHIGAGTGRLGRICSRKSPKKTAGPAFDRPGPRGTYSFPKRRRYRRNVTLYATLLTGRRCWRRSDWPRAHAGGRRRCRPLGHARGRTIVLEVRGRLEFVLGPRHFEIDVGRILRSGGTRSSLCCPSP